MIWGYTAVFDEEKIGQQHFMLMINRTMEKMEEKVVDIIISSKTNALAKELGVTIESSAYVHGQYDWVITFTAEDIRQASQFSNSVLTFHPGVIENMSIIQTLIFIKKQYILNPEKMHLKDFL